MKVMQRWPILLSTLILWLAACAQEQPAPVVYTATPTPAAVGVAAQILPTIAETAAPILTATPAPTLTPIPTSTPLPTSTSTPTATSTPVHPLMVEVMREQIYPGSEITFVQTLESGSNYDRYIISYESEGNTIYALFTVPFGDPPPSGWPVIIFNHGYIPPEQYRTTERYVAYVDGFARNGYIVLRSDYRGHGSSEGEAVSSYRSPGYTADVLNAVATVKRYPAADPERIGMWGHSMGGNITLRAMVISDEIKAGVIWGGVVVSYPDLFTLWRRGDGPTPTPDPESQRGRWRTEWFETYGTPEENPAFWASISANSYVSDLSGPIQLHHATADESVPYVFSEILYGEIQAVNLPAELYLYEGDNHNISVNFATAMQRSIEFFDRYVKGE